MRTARLIGALALALSLLTVSGFAATVRWHDLRSVRVTVSNASLPPPSGKARTTSFTTAQRLARAQAALNSKGIRKLAKSRPNRGCTGGYNVVIAIVKHDSTRVTMRAYRCAGTTYGNTGGDVPGFLRTVGISPPR